MHVISSKVEKTSYAFLLHLNHGLLNISFITLLPNKTIKIYNYYSCFAWSLTVVKLHCFSLQTYQDKLNNRYGIDITVSITSQ